MEYYLDTFVLTTMFLNRQSSTEDEEPLVPIDPSDLIHLFPDADNAQYHDGLTDSDGRLSQIN